MMRRTELVGASVCVIAACSGPGNTGKENSAPSAELVAAVPWANGGIAPRNAAGEPVMPGEPVYPPIGVNTPDPGSRAIDCRGLADIDLPSAPELLQTFEPDDADPGPNPVGVAESWSSNDDETKGAFRVPGDAKWYPELAGRFAEAFGLAAEKVTGAPSCDGKPNAWVFHFRGGRFNYYGAKAERPLAVPSACPANSDVCVDPSSPYASAAWDVSLYDGVTFWARRGPDGNPAMLFSLQDKHTSDALNRGAQTFCRRIKDCYPVCQNGLPCTLNPAIENPGEPDAPPKYRCFDPAAGPPPISIEPALLDEVFPRCGPSACSRKSYYPDPDFDDRECKPYEFTGSQAGHYCYGDVPPPPDEERCGDAWVAPVRLSTDWKLYVIPFTEFRQVGFAKRAPFLDLHSIYSIALQFPVGFADVYVDNVSFYRRRR
jgi:hypothetical protein